jgi:biopolymer transport protein ExbB
VFTCIIKRKNITGDVLQMIDLFFKGGILMFPLFIGSLVMLALIIERAVVFAGSGIPRSFIDGLKSGGHGTGVDAAYPSPGGRKGTAPGVLMDIITMKDQPREVIEKHISMRGDLYLHHLEAHLHILELIGRMAPMLGLLGTVMGMVAAFRQVASVERVVDPSILAGGIWEALITTVAGLIVGIPSLIAHHLFTSRIERTAFLMKHYSEDLITFIKGAYD